MANTRNLILLSLAFLLSAPASAMAGWPDFQQPAPSVGGGDNDAAVIVGIELYAFVPPVLGAKSNANAWHDFFTKTRGIPVKNVTLLRNADGTLEDMQRAASEAARKAKKGGAVWFVFIGHGAPSKDGKDGLLIGVDAQQKAESLEARSLSREDLLTRLGKTSADSINVVLDACFSGRSPTGAPLATGIQPLITTNLSRLADPRMTVLTAAKSDQFAGALPGTLRPAFSYLVLGALRGWADTDKNGDISAGEVLDYAAGSLDATLRGRQQTPTLSGSASARMAASARETGPDLAALAKLEEPDSPNAAMFTISKLPSVPEAKMPDYISSTAPKGNWRDLDVDALERYDSAVKFDRDESATPAQKSLKWTQLAKDAPQFAGQAHERAGKWEKYAQDEAAAEKARRDREAARDTDWKKLSRLLALEVVPKQDKKAWARMFVKAYGASSKDNPYSERLSSLLSVGDELVFSLRVAIKEGRLDKLIDDVFYDLSLADMSRSAFYYDQRVRIPKTAGDRDLHIGVKRDPANGTSQIFYERAGLSHVFYHVPGGFMDTESSEESERKLLKALASSIIDNADPSALKAAQVLAGLQTAIAEGQLDARANDALFRPYVMIGKHRSEDWTAYQEALKRVGSLKTVKVEDRRESGTHYLYFEHLSKTYKVREIPAQLPQRMPSFVDDTLKLIANTILEELSLLENGSKPKAPMK